MKKKKYSCRGWIYDFQILKKKEAGPTTSRKTLMAQACIVFNSHSSRPFCKF